MARKTEKTEPKTTRINRASAANKVIAAMSSKTTLSELGKAADALFVTAGGKSSPKAATWHVRHALETAEALGLVKLVRPTDLFVERV